MGSSVASSITSQGSQDRQVQIANMPPINADRLPASIRDELRRAVGLYCLDIVFQRDAMKVAQMRKLMHVQLLCNGEDMFSDLFENRQDNVVNRQGASTKQLKTLFSQTDKAYYLGKHINVKTMSSVNFASDTL